MAWYYGKHVSRTTPCFVCTVDEMTRYASLLVLEVATLLCRYAKIHCIFVLFAVLAGLSGISSQGAYSEMLDNLIFFFDRVCCTEVCLSLYSCLTNSSL